MNLPASHPVAEFRARLEAFAGYPSGVVAVPEYIDGTAFFSAGLGLWVDPHDETPPRFPVGGVMFIGHNLDALGPYLDRLASGLPHGGPVKAMTTWRNLYRLLDAAKVDRRECFFTNAYVGLKDGDAPTGKLLGSDEPQFSAWCTEFLLHQIEVMKPAVIASLGLPACQFVATLSTDLSDWQGSRMPAMVRRAATFGTTTTQSVPLVHPSGYHTSLGKRALDGRIGLDAESYLLRTAIDARLPFA